MGSRQVILDHIDRNRILEAKAHPHLAATAARMAREGHLERLLPGIYSRPGAGLLVRLAATCCAIPDAVVCRETARALHLGYQDVSGEIHVASALRSKPPAGIRVHHGLPPQEFVLDVEGIRVVKHFYACLELAATDGGAAMDEAIRDELVHPEDLVYGSSAFRGRRGARAIRRAAHEAQRRPWSTGERRLQRVLIRGGYHEWVANPRVRIDAKVYRPDILFRGCRVVLEFDGLDFHTGEQARQRDYERQNALVAAGFRVLRFTWHMIDDPEAVLRVVGKALRGSHARDHE